MRIYNTILLLIAGCLLAAPLLYALLLLAAVLTGGAGRYP